MENNGYREREGSSSTLGLVATGFAAVGNIIHASYHLFPAALAVTYSVSDGKIEPSGVAKILSSPWMGVGSAGLLILGLYSTYRDHRQHRSHHEELSNANREIIRLKELLGTNLISRSDNQNYSLEEISKTVEIWN